MYVKIIHKEMKMIYGLIYYQSEKDNAELEAQKYPIIKCDTIIRTWEKHYVLPEETDDIDELRSALDNAYEKIRELEDKIEIAQSMIDDARSKIEDARFDIDGARLLRDKTLLDDAEIGLDDASSELDDAEVELQQ